MSSIDKSAPKTPSSKPAHFAVYLARSDVAVQDPDIPGPRYHHVIYVATETRRQTGMKFQVVGDITSRGGMTYESRPCPNPQYSEEEAYSSMNFLGYTAVQGFPHSWDEVLRRLPTPPKQKEYNIATNRTELVKSWNPLTFYAPGDDRHVPWKCTEWTNNHALPALYEAALITMFDEEEAKSIAQDVDKFGV